MFHNKNTSVSESLFHKLQNKIVNNIEITIKSTRWKPHADHTSHLVVCYNHVQTENCRKAKENTISTVRMRG